MNIIEAEDLVKGLPDQALFQEAQFPSGRIPQYLAVSEVQRRQDMRQRFQAAQQGQQSSVKDQILQGGIGSTGMAPEMSSAPPMAPQMPPQGGPMPPQMPPPMGMAMGGIVPYRMSQGSTAPDLRAELQVQQILKKTPRLRTQDENEVLREAGYTLTTPSGIELDPNSSVARFNRLLGTPFIREKSGRPYLSPEELSTARGTGATNERIARMLGASQVTKPDNLVPYDLSQRSVPSSRGEFSPEKVSSNLDRSALPSMDFNNVFFGSGASPTEAPRVANVSAVTAPSDAAPGRPNTNVSPGLPAADAAMRQQTNADTPSLGGTGLESLMRNLMKTQGLSPEEQAYINLNKQIAEQGLPPPIDLSQYVQAAQQRQQSAREEARQDAIASTLMNLGTGLFAGDPAAGMQRATQEAMATLREGRKEASAEGRAAEQLQLQAAQQNRQNIIDNMKFRTESVGAVANIMSGNRKADRETQMQAAQIVSNIQINLKKIQNDLTVAGMGRNDANRKVQSEARNRATELVLKSAEGKFPPPSAQDMATQVDTITSQFLGGMDSSASATQSSSPRFTINQVPTPRR